MPVADDRTPGASAPRPVTAAAPDGGSPPEATGPGLAHRIADLEEAAAEEASRARGLRQYWRSISPARQRVVTLAAVLVVLGSAMAVWFGRASAQDWPVQRDLSYTVSDATSVTVRFEVTKPPQMSAVCEVVAQEVGKAVVGRADVAIPPSQARTTTHEATVRTTTLAVIGQVRTCRPAE